MSQESNNVVTQDYTSHLSRTCDALTAYTGPVRLELEVWNTFISPAGKEVWQNCWREVGVNKDASLPLPVWLRLLLLMALRNMKDVAARTSVRGVYMGPLYLPYGRLAALLSELHYKFFAFDKASLPRGADESVKMLKQRPRALNAKNSNHDKLARLERRKIEKFNKVRIFGAVHARPCAYA